MKKVCSRYQLSCESDPGFQIHYLEDRRNRQVFLIVSDFGLIIACVCDRYSIKGIDRLLLELPCKRDVTLVALADVMRCSPRRLDTHFLLSPSEGSFVADRFFQKYQIKITTSTGGPRTGNR